MELVCSVQEYAWGKLGSSSQVARLAVEACPPFTPVEETPYAELWMGAHPNGPARLASSGELLSEHIATSPSCLGEATNQAFGPNLPFLFKVLSVGKALSIQAHPDKAHAEALHRERPSVYKDANHKPELAIALTEFEGLCGFRPLEEIQGFLASVPELAALLGPVAPALASASPSDYRGQLMAAFQALMEAGEEDVAKHLAELHSRLSSSSDPMALLLKRLYSQYPGDRGCFVIYFLNVLRLSPGESMFLGPNVPHAYLQGDCVECMANSDNVVRAGLTPKLIDTPTLVAMLDYTCSPADSRKFPGSPHPSQPGCVQFHPPVPDFAVASHRVEGDYQLPPRSSASILLVTEGRGGREGGGPLAPGTVLFLPAGEELKVTAEASDPLVAYQAYCNL